MVRRTVVVSVIAGLLAVGGAVAAQVRPLPPPPDLSGSWSVSPTDGLGYSPFGARFTVKQDASTITIATDRETVTYRLDDSKTPRTTRTVDGRTWTRISRARFVTAALLVTTEIDAGETGHWEDMFIVSLESPGVVTVVACSATASTDAGMGTHVFKYTKS